MAKIVSFILLAVLAAGLCGGVAAQPASDGAPASDGFWQRNTLTGNWGGLRDTLAAQGVTFSLQEQDEVWGNLSGGIRRGAAYVGQTLASVTLDLDRLVGWRGATAFTNVYQIHGRGPTIGLVGNLQTVSGLEATASTRLFDLWLEQSLFDGRFSLRLGQGAANDEFMQSRYAQVFINSSFGFPAMAALALPSGGPNYPLATPMLRLKFTPIERVTLMAAVFNGDPAGPGTGDPQRRNASGTAFRMRDHTVSWVELAYATGGEGLASAYKVGAWYHSGRFADLRLDNTGRSLADQASTGIPRQHVGNYAVYAVLDQKLWQQPDAADKGIGLFASVIGGPGDRNTVSYSLIAGVNWTGPFPGRDNDVAGLAVGYVGVGGAQLGFGRDLVGFTQAAAPRTHETVLEATYQFQIAPWWTVQPDVQYIINPGAGLPNPANGNRPLRLKDAAVVGVRGSITF